MKKPQRSGLIAGGNWIIDHVKLVDTYPSQDALANILDQSCGNGGAPYNLLVDLARLKVSWPLEAVGLLGRDAMGRQIREDCRARGIDVRQLRETVLAPTSYTDVMTVRESGRRTFFHCRGANAFLQPEHFDFKKTKAKIFHLGYLLLLDGLDVLDAEYGTRAGRVLAQARQAGLWTSVDIVSEDGNRFSDIVRPTLPHVDYLFLNEFEAGRTTSRVLRTKRGIDLKQMESAARDLLAAGVNQAVIIHFPEGAVACSAEGIVRQGSVRVPSEEVKGTVGAGDAFAAGVLSGVHEGKPLAESLRRGVCVAATCLLDPTSSGGIKPLGKCLRWGEPRGFYSLL